MASRSASPLGLDAGRCRGPEDCQELVAKILPPQYRPLGLQRREEPAMGWAAARQLGHHQPPPAEQWLQPSAHHQVALVLRPP